MKFKYFFVFTFLFSFSAKASECFVIKDLNKNKIIKNSNKEVCETRFSPCSSFKIPISLMGFDSGVLKNEKKSGMQYEEWYEEGTQELQSRSHDPETWMRNPRTWYSQEAVTKKIGMEKLKEYVEKFDYGNKDVSGDIGKNNGLTHSWLESSLKISPLEQIDFISKMLDKKLGVSDHAYEMTKNITYIQEIKEWKLYGKTGSCMERNDDLTEDPNRFTGWFIGWIEKDDKKIAFAKFIKDEKDVAKNDYVGIRARNDVIEELEAMDFDKLQ